MPVNVGVTLSSGGQVIVSCPELYVLFAPDTLLILKGVNWKSSHGFVTTIKLAFENVQWLSSSQALTWKGVKPA